jgi:8-oxo-dGTP diphosphatase
MAIPGPIVAVGAVIWRGPEQLLLVRRGRPPREHEWSIPGGRMEAGETLQEALVREVGEETGLVVQFAGLIDVVDFIEREVSGSLAAHYVLIDFSAHWEAGEARAGSDAAECGWFSPADALSRLSWEETRRVVRASARQLWEIEL